jgi:excisionase family DNA binding protein
MDALAEVVDQPTASMTIDWSEARVKTWVRVAHATQGASGMTDEVIGDDMLTAAEVARCLKISKRMVYELHASGTLAGYRFGRNVRFASSDVDTYRASCRSVGTNRTSAGATSSTAAFKAAATGLAASFRAAGLKPKLTRSTARRARASTPLQLACSDKTP